MAGHFDDCVWLNEPVLWRRDGSTLKVTTDDKTDFWCETHYGFTRDAGHFFGARTEGDFTAQVRVQSEYTHLYDQAGIMVRLDEKNWIKAGVELSDGTPMLSSVLTIGRSDWSTAPYQGNAEDFWLRATVSKGVIRLQVSSDGVTWPLVRLAPFPIANVYHVGPMCCTPERAGLEVSFSSFELRRASNKDLHDLT